MKNYTIQNKLPSLEVKEGNNVNITGLLHNFRIMSWGTFIFIRYENYLIQCIGEKNIFNEELLKKESLIEISGTFVSANIKNNMINPNHLEIKLSSFKIINASLHESLPLEISKKEINAELNSILNYRQLALRNMQQKSIFKISSQTEMAFSNSLVNLGFTKINSPKIVNMGSEGGSEVFSLKYFEENAFLTQSPQFYKQMMTAVFGKVFEVNPVFRAEKFNTSRHINEYISLDIEMSLNRGYMELIEIEVFILNEIFNSLKENCHYEINLLNIEMPNIENYAILKFSEIHEILLSEFGHEPEERNDLSPTEEKLICEYAKNKYNTEFVFVTHYPISKRPFYTKVSETNAEESLSFDLLFRGIEITTGGERIHEFCKLKEKMNAMNMSEKGLEEYLETFKYGMPKHGGFGLGLERLVSKICNLENVKEASLFPRTRNRLTP